MSDFGTGACDFHSAFASDFRTESNDYAGDFRDYASDFGGAPRTAKRQGNKGGGNLVAHRESGKPRSRVQRHAIRP